MDFAFFWRRTGLVPKWFNNKQEVILRILVKNIYLIKFMNEKFNYT